MLGKSLKYAGLMLALLLLVLVSLPWWFNWNWLRGPISSAVEAQTGRTLEIGNIDVDFGWTTRITLQSLAFENAEWAGDTPMLTLEELAAGLRVLPLLRFDLQLPELAVTGLRADLVKRAGDQANWAFMADDSDESPAPDSRADIPAIENLKLRDIRVRYRDETRPFDYRAQIDSLDAAGGGGQPLKAEGQGSVQDRALALSLNAGSIETLRGSDQPWPVELSLAVGRSNLWLNGSIGQPQTLSGLAIDMRIKGPNLDDWYQVTSIPLPESPPYDLSGRLTHADGLWQFKGFDGRLGDSDLRGDFGVQLGGERLAVTADLQSDKLDFDDLGPLIGVPPDASETASADQVDEAEQAAGDERVIPDQTLPLGKLRVADAQVSLKADSVLAPGLPIEDLTLDVDLENGVLRVTPFALGFAGGRLNTYATIDASVDPGIWHFDIRARDFQLRRLLSSVDLKEAGEGRLGGDIRIRGQGENLRRALADSNGRVTVVVNGGRFSGLLLELIGLDVAESLGMLIGDDQKVNIRCLVVDLDVDEGQVNSRQLVLDTADTRVDGELQADLATERFELRLEPEPKDPSLFSARTPFEIDGRFSDVNVAPDYAVLGLRLGAAAALGAVAPPAALLAFLEPGPATDAQCDDLLSDIDAPPQSGDGTETPADQSGK